MLLCQPQHSSSLTQAVTQAPSSLLSYLTTLDIAEPDPSESWNKLCRKVAKVIHFAGNVSKLIPVRGKCHPPPASRKWTRSQQRCWIENNDSFAPTVVQMKTARQYWILRAQASLPRDFQRLMKQLNPVQDSDGLWRVLGRTSVDVDAAPYLIPGDHALARVLIQHYHTKYHSGSQTTLAAVRNEFWITKGQTLTNALVNKCCRCRYLRKTVIQMEMAPLKPYQTTASQVFDTIALDLCGPYMTKSDRRHTRQNQALAGKVWVMIIICAASRAVHLELVEGYDTASFLEALDNFTSTRGKPSKIVADRGSQIVSADNTIQSVWDVISETQARNHLCETTEWEFVPSGAHSFMGMAERVVRSFKKTMEAVTFSKAPILTKLRFSRLLSSISSIMNDRPLAVGRIRVSKLDDLCLLRPNDLLLGRCSDTNTPIVEVNDEIFEDMCASRKAYLTLLKQKQALLSNFWIKWYQIVHATLVPRPKWQDSGRVPCIGDIVLIRDTNPVRGVW